MSSRQRNMAWIFVAPKDVFWKDVRREDLDSVNKTKEFFRHLGEMVKMSDGAFIEHMQNHQHGPPTQSWSKGHMQKMLDKYGPTEERTVLVERRVDEIWEPVGNPITNLIKKSSSK